MRRLTVSPGTMSVSAPRREAVKQTLANRADRTMTAVHVDLFTDELGHTKESCRFGRFRIAY